MGKEKNLNDTSGTDVSKEKEEAVSEEADKETVHNERRVENRRKEQRRKSRRRKADRVDDLKEEIIDKDGDISRFKEEIESLNDRLLRQQADFENYKKRTIKQQRENKKMAIKDFSLDVILINDDLLRAIEASLNVSDDNSCEEAHKSFVDGVSMISKRIEEMLSKYSIVEIDSLNQEFDPNFNEAVEIETSSEVDYDTVTKVYQKGFRIDDLVVRSAKVKVAKFLKDDEDIKDGECEDDNM